MVIKAKHTWSTCAKQVSSLILLSSVSAPSHDGELSTVIVRSELL